MTGERIRSVIVQKLPGNAHATGLERLPSREPRRVRGDSSRPDGARQCGGVDRSQSLTRKVQLRGSSNVRVPPVIARDEARVHEPAAELDVVGAEHLTDIGQPVEQASVHVVLPKRPSRLDCGRGERQDQGAVDVRKDAEVQAGLQDQRLEAGWQLHAGSLPRFSRRRRIALDPFRHDCLHIVDVAPALHFGHRETGPDEAPQQGEKKRVSLGDEPSAKERASALAAEEAADRFNRQDGVALVRLPSIPAASLIETWIRYGALSSSSM